MTRFLNTLYITSEKTYLHQKGESIEIVFQDKKKLIPMLNIGNIVFFGKVLVTPFLLNACRKHNISIVYLTKNGRFLCRIEGPVAGNVLLRKEQYRLSDDEGRSAQLTRYILLGKISNQKAILSRGIRDHADSVNVNKLKEAVRALERNIRLIEKEDKLDNLRGLEGASSERYFSVFGELVTSQKEEFVFNCRSRRPPLDNVNALLSFVYTLLYQDMVSACESVGLDPAVGFLHRDRPGRLSLALDLMEEFRGPFADRLVLSLINRKEVCGSHFVKTASGAVLMNDEARRIVINAYQSKKGDVLTHQFLNKKMHYAVMFLTQAKLLARYIRGDIDGYPVYFYK